MDLYLKWPKWIRSLIHFQLIFVKDIRSLSRFIIFARGYLVPALFVEKKLFFPIELPFFFCHTILDYLLGKDIGVKLLILWWNRKAQEGWNSLPQVAIISQYLLTLWQNLAPWQTFRSGDWGFLIEKILEAFLIFNFFLPQPSGDFSQLLTWFRIPLLEMETRRWGRKTRAHLIFMETGE